jgi:mannitol-1-/sugar-/sorbitol-6-/2-deoxyglucose-6-phosphatase
MQKNTPTFLIVYTFAIMNIDTVIFDMDGLLIDSEPLWNIAADEIFAAYGFSLSTAQYSITTGLRTKEFIEYWFQHFKIPMQNAAQAENEVVQKVIDLVMQKGKPMPGLQYIFNFFIAKKFKIGLASSSPLSLINEVVQMLGIQTHLHHVSSAAELPFGKPHPQVYLDCAKALNAHPSNCLCFEDSFYGMIAAKAARMKCVVVPSKEDFKQLRWAAADAKMASLLNFNDLLLKTL